LASQHTATFIDEALAPYFGSLISFVRDAESRHARGGTSSSSAMLWEPVDGKSGSNIRAEETRVTRIIKGFNIDWKNSIEKIHEEIMTEFANFTLGTQIFQVSLLRSSLYDCSHFCLSRVFTKGVHIFLNLVLDGTIPSELIAVRTYFVIPEWNCGRGSIFSCLSYPSNTPS
uniref:Vacuolar protein sorting-associated protein 52 homolog n=1 Tax=Echinostoma caproni TaxID=27848 RepID=A0A183BBP5_9TREM